MDEERLINKLRLIEALFAGATTAGEKVAAEHARERILERLRRWEKEAPPAEYRFSMADMWSRKVFVALLRRYGIRPYRYSGQRYTTVMARVSKRFVDETLWPEFLKFSETLESYLADVTDRVVQEVIHQDSSEAEVVDKSARTLQSPAPPATSPATNTASVSATGSDSTTGSASATGPESPTTSGNRDPGRGAANPRSQPPDKRKKNRKQRR